MTLARFAFQFNISFLGSLILSTVTALDNIGKVLCAVGGNEVHIYFSKKPKTQSGGDLGGMARRTKWVRLTEGGD